MQLEKQIENAQNLHYYKGNIHVWCAMPVSENDEGYSMQCVCSCCQPKHKLNLTDSSECQVAPDTIQKPLEILKGEILEIYNVCEQREMPQMKPFGIFSAKETKERDPCGQMHVMMSLVVG